MESEKAITIISCGGNYIWTLQDLKNEYKDLIRLLL